MERHDVFDFEYIHALVHRPVTLWRYMAVT